jgi:hypothetical protein
MGVAVSPDGDRVALVATEPDISASSLSERLPFWPEDIGVDLVETVGRTG